MKYIFLILVINFSCKVKQNIVNTQYFRLDSSIYDKLQPEVILKIYKDSFVLVKYLDPVYADVSRGILKYNNDLKILVVKENVVFSLNTGRPETDITESKAKYHVKEFNNELQVIKYKSGKIDSTFKSNPYKATTQLNNFEKWCFTDRFWQTMMKSKK